MMNQVFLVDAGGVYLENATSFLPNINRIFLEGATTTNGRNKRQCESAPNWGKLLNVTTLTHTCRKRDKVM